MWSRDDRYDGMLLRVGRCHANLMSLNLQYYQNHHPGYSPHGYPPHGYPHQTYPLQGYQYQGYQPHEYPAHAYSYPPSGSTASSFGKQVDNVANIVGAGLVDGFKDGIKDQLMEEFGFEGVMEVVGTLLSWLL
jgi:hypothetical protein